jgi:hypothetical protein
MVPTLHASIKHTFWHDVWTNAMHDDRDFVIARMLAWQAMQMDGNKDWPFKGKDLYSLLVMGRIPFLLHSLPFKARGQDGAQQQDEMDPDAPKEAAGIDWLERYDPTVAFSDSSNPSTAFLTAVRREMAKISRLITFQLPPSDIEQFQKFWKSARLLFIEEYKSRCLYNNQS